MRAALPADVQGDAVITVNSDSPFLAPARRMETVTNVGATLTIAAILITMMALWNSDLRSARGILLALGAGRRWMRGTGAALAGTLAVIGVVVGTTAGTIGSALMMLVTDLAVPFSWSPVLSGAAGVLAALAIGALGVPTTPRAARRA